MNIENEGNILQYISNIDYLKLVTFYQNLHIKHNNNLSNSIIIPKIQSYLQNNKNEKKKTLFLKDYIKLKINFLNKNQQEIFLKKIEAIKNNINYDSYIKPIKHRIEESQKVINNLQKKMRTILKENKEFDEIYKKIKKLQKQKVKINNKNKSKYREINKTKDYNFNTKLTNLKKLKTQLKQNESNLNEQNQKIKNNKEKYTNEFKNELLIHINNEINELILPKKEINQLKVSNVNKNNSTINNKHYKMISINNNTKPSYFSPNISKKYNNNKNEDKGLLKIVTNLLKTDKSFNQDKVTWQLRNYKWDKDYFIADTNWDGWCGYHSIVRFAKIHNLDLHEGFNNYKNEPNTGDNLVEWYIESLKKLSDEKFNKIFGEIYSSNGNLFTRKYTIQVLGKKKNIKSWLDIPHLIILSYLLQVHFEVHTDSTGTYKIISNNIEEIRPVIQLVHMDNDIHYNFLINKAIFKNIIINP